DLDTPVVDVGKMLRDDHADRHGFLSGGAGGGPDAQGFPRAVSFDQLGENRFADGLEGMNVAEEGSFVGGEGVDDFAMQGLRRARFVAQSAEQSEQTVVAFGGGEGAEARFNQVVLVVE